MKRLANKNVLITGGSSGIGLATAIEFIDEGATVWITGRNLDKLESIKQQNEKLNIIISDSSNLNDIQSLSNYFIANAIKLDVLFLNAGVAKFSPIENTTEEEFDYQFNTNVKGAYFTLQKLLPNINDGASIIINGSTNATANAIGSSIYAATKAAIIKIAKVAANELAPRHIRVNILSPGPTLTPGLEGVADTNVLEYFASNMALNRVGKANELAKAALFLASEDSSFITGTELIADGGLLNYSLK